MRNPLMAATSRVLRQVTLSLALTIGLALPAAAQSGEIFGRVTDSTGAVLPGTTVVIESPSLIRPQAAVSTPTGAYRFPNLPIGVYLVRFELAGFKTFVRDGIRIEVGFNAEVNARLDLSTVQETVTVTGESPIVDTKQVSTGGTFNREMLELLPSARDPWEILKMTPGLVMTNTNVGGNMSGQQLGYAAHGGGQGNSMWNLDGAQTTDMAATGASAVYYDFDSFEEIQITTGGSDASIQTGGVNINLITKSGSNMFKGSGRYFIIDDKMQAQNVTSELFGQGAGSGNPIQNIKDYGFEAGGPIIKNKLWFWGAYGKQDIKVGILGFFNPTPQCTGSNRPSTFDQLGAIEACLATDLTVLENYNAKLQFQPVSSHRFSFLYNYADKIRNARGAGPLNPPETTFRQTGPVGTFKGTHNWILSDRLAIESAATYVGGGFLLSFHEDSLESVQRKFNITTGLNSRSGSRSGPFDRPMTEIRTDANYFASNVLGGDHSIKFGVRWKDSPFDSGSHIGGFATARFRTLANDQEVPSEADLHRDAATSTAMSVVSAYVSDSFSRGRLRLTLGLRFDYQDDEAKSSNVPENPIIPAQLPAVTFPGADSGVTYADWSPRLSLTYDLLGTGKTVAKASYARYYGQGIFTAGTLNPVGAVTLRHTWADTNGDQFVQANELGALRQIIGNYNPSAPGSPATQNTVDPALENDRTEEAIVSLDHELAANFGVGLAYIYRRYDQFNRLDRVGVSASDFIPVAFTETDARFASRTPAVTYFQLRPGLTWPTAQRRQEDPFYRRYHGIELTARKRMSRNWTLNSSVTWNRSLQYLPEGSFDDPTNIQFQNGEPGSPSDTRWLFKAGGGYALPWAINVSAYVSARDGFLRNEVVQSPSRPGGLGRVNVMFEPQGVNRYPSIWTADAHIEKWVGVKKARFAVNFDVFNIGNVNIVTSQGNVRNTTNFGRVFQIVAPRVVRLGVRFSF